MKVLYLAGCVATAALAGILFGFDTAVISGVTHDLQRVYSLSPQALGFTVSAALWGTLVGAVSAGKPGDRYGSRNVLFVMALLYILSGLGCALAWDWPSLVFFRFIGGLGIGGTSVLAPVYISEIAPAKRRGVLVGLFQFNIVLGILIAYLSNYIVASLDLGELEWRWKLGVTSIPAVVFFLCLTRIPHSPRWLATQGRTSEAERVLTLLGVADPAGELSHILAAADKAVGMAKLSWRRHRKPMILAVSLACFNQLTGINAILYYANDIFAAAGFDRVSANLQSVAIGGTNLLFTMLAMSIIDKVGRKPLLLIGAVGTAVCLAGTGLVQSGLAAPSLLIWMLIGFIAFFAFSQGAVIWVYISEIFPTPVRARGQSLGSGTHWLMNALIAFAFPVVATYSKGAAFFVFAAFMALQFVVVLLFFPETKRQSLEELESITGH